MLNTSALQHQCQSQLLRTCDLIMPLFVKSGNNIREELKSLPGIQVFSVDNIAEAVKKLTGKGINNLALIEISSDHDSAGSFALREQSAIIPAIEKIKSTHSDLKLFVDLCLCQYTDHGHCGIVKDGAVSNDLTLSVIEELALKYANAGADVLMPSGMLDGVIAHLRRSLDSHKLSKTRLMNQSAKFSSNYFGPFRKSAQADSSNDISKASYQVPPQNLYEALREIECDVNEGADMLMVKPALAYLDVIQAAKEKFDLPLAAFCTSGEFNLLKILAAQQCNSQSVILESLQSIKRAGADLIVTYFAEDIAEVLG